MSARLKLAAGLVATTMISTAGVAFGVRQEAHGQNGAPPAPPVRELTVSEPVAPDDGMQRVVVTVAGGDEPEQAETETDDSSGRCRHVGFRPRRRVGAAHLGHARRHRIIEPRRSGRLGLPISEQTFYALAADPYESSQWTMDNTGDNLTNTSTDRR
jgi:hypothetical protein